MRNMNELPPFIQNEFFPIVKVSSSQSEAKRLLINLIEKGLGFWKEENQLIVEFAKNKLHDEEKKIITQYASEFAEILEFNKKYYPLSFSQHMMCIQSELYKNTTYQLTIPFFLNFAINKENMTQALQLLIHRHAILRTVFPKLQHHWIQVVLADLPVEIKYQDIKNLLDDQQQTEINKLIAIENSFRFSLEMGPLFKITFFETTPERNLVLLTAHHAIFDGLSFPIFIHDLIQIYQSLEQNKEILLPALQAQYTDFVLEQKNVSDNIKNKEIQWWKTQLENCPEQSPIPSDFASNQIGEEKNKILSLGFSKNEYESFLDFSKNHQISITLLILSGIYFLMYRLTKESDLVIGSILNLRNRVQYENLIGDFNNLVPLRLDISNQWPIKEFFKKVQTVFFDAFSHQRITFNELIQHVQVKRNKNNLPFYNVFFDSLNLDAFQRNLAQDNVEILSHEELQVQAIPLMDLFFMLIQRSGQAFLHCSYNPKLLKPETVSQLLNQLRDTLNEFIQSPDKLISEFEIKVSSKSALFCLPGADGQVDVFSRLTQNLEHFRCYALQYKALNTIPDIASNFISLVLKMPRSSSSVLLALSTGGIVALEMLQQLSQQGLSFFSELILLDSPVPYMPLTKLSREHVLLLLINFSIKQFGRSGIKLLSLEQFEQETRNLTFEQKAEYSYNKIKSDSLIPLPSIEEFYQWITLLEANREAVANYVPKPYEGSIKVIYIASSDTRNPFQILIPEQVSDAAVDKKTYWMQLFPNSSFEFYTIPQSDHFSLLTGEYIKSVAKIISSLDSVEL